MKNTLIITGIFMLILSWVVYKAQPGKGIVILNDYPHAVALCGDEIGPDKSYEIKGEAHMRLWDGNTFTINWGHLKDKEIPALRKLAREHCSTLKYVAKSYPLCCEERF